MKTSPATVSDDGQSVPPLRPSENAESSSRDLTLHTGARSSLPVPEGREAKISTEDLRVYFGKTRVLHGVELGRRQGRSDGNYWSLWLWEVHLPSLPKPHA